MEGIGSRLGRSSRYGAAQAAFSGPVRKWKKEWVNVCSNPNLTRKSKARNNKASRLLLCKWTPAANSADEPPRRRSRYAPVAAVQKLKTDSKEKDNEVDTSELPCPRPGADETSMADEVYEKLEMFNASIRAQPTISSIFGEDDDDDLDLGLCMSDIANSVKRNKKNHSSQTTNMARTWLTD